MECILETFVVSRFGQDMTIAALTVRRFQGWKDCSRDGKTVPETERRFRRRKDGSRDRDILESERCSKDRAVST